MANLAREVIAIVDQPEWEGGRLYAENLVRSLLALPSPQRPEVVWIGGDRPLHPVVASVPSVRVSPMPRLARLAFSARAARAVGATLVYPFPSSLGSSTSSAHWVPDLQHLRLPEMFSAPAQLRRSVWLRATVASSRRVVLSSHDAAADLRRALPVARRRSVHVLSFATPVSADDVDRTSADARAVLDRLPSEFLYVPNQMWRHKDHPTAIRAAAQLHSEGLAIPVVFSGDRLDARSPGWAGYVAHLADELLPRSGVHFLGRLPRAVQLAVLERATVVVQPSLFEGWSTVVEDARAFDKPLLLSRIPVHVEQQPPRGRYFAPGNSADLARRLREALSDGSARAPSFGTLEAAAAARVQAVARQLLTILCEGREGSG